MPVIRPFDKHRGGRYGGGMTGMTAREALLCDRAAAAPMETQLRAWAATNSGTGNLAGLANVARELADAFSALPGAVELVEPARVTAIDREGAENEIAHGRHLVVRVRPDAARRVLLTGHMDTVFAADHPFQTLTDLPDGVLNGPGTADMKGGIAVMLAALRALEAEGSTLGYDVMINSDEETGSASSSALIAEMARGKVAALTYEPAALPDGTLAGARPGSGNFSFSITGRAAHAGRNPQDGRNAIVAAADLVLRLSTLRREGLSVNPARIDGGGPNNVVPDRAIVRVNLRPATPELEAEAKAALQAAVAAVSVEHDVSIHAHGGFGRPPKPLTPAAENLFGLVRDAGRDLGQSISWKATGGVCDGNNIAACGVPVVDTMGVRGGAIHSDQEYVILASLGERAALSALTLARLAEGRL